MNSFFKAILTGIFKGVLSVCILVLVCAVGFGSYKVYKDVSTITEKLEELFSNDMFIAEWILKTERDAIERDNTILDTIKENNKKPSYSYLKSVTVRIFQKENADSDMGWVGTGSIIKITDDYTYILTNKHVAPMNNKENIFVLNNGDYQKAEVLKVGAIKDLSLIRTSTPLKGKRAINGYAGIYPSQRVFSVGMYLSNFYIYTEGTAAGNQVNGSSIDLLLNMPCSYGCSGSGVFNINGDLVGVVFATNKLGIFDTDSSKAIAVPAIAVKLFLKGLFAEE